MKRLLLQNKLIYYFNTYKTIYQLKKYLKSQTYYF